MFRQTHSRRARSPALVWTRACSLPGPLPGATWSDHWSFWKIGAPATLPTNTALFRNLHDHELGDVPHLLDYEKMADLARALPRIVASLATE